MKRTTIIYASNHGTTEKVAAKIAKALKHHDVTLFNIRKSDKIDLTPYDQIIIGGSVHAGLIQKKLQKFMHKNMTALLEKPLGLFLCCMYEKEAENQFNKSFPVLLRHHAKVKKCVGGEFIFEKMNFIEKLMVRKIAGIHTSVSRLNENMIDEFGKAIDS